MLSLHQMHQAGVAVTGLRGLKSSSEVWINYLFVLAVLRSFVAYVVRYSQPVRTFDAVDAIR